MKNIKYLVVFLLLVVAASVGFYYFQKVNEDKFYECLEYSLPEEIVAGTRIEIKISCNNPKYSIEQAFISYIHKDNSDKSVELKESFGSKVDTIVGEQSFSFYFTVKRDGKEYRFPKEKYFQSQMVAKNIDLKTEDVSHEELTFELIQTDQIPVEIEVPDETTISEIRIYSRFSSLEDFDITKMSYDQVYSADLDGPEKAKFMEYYFTIDTPEKTLRYPSEDTFQIYDPKLTELKENITNYAKENGLRIWYSFDDFGEGAVSINGAERVSPLSTIKDLIMIAVYEKLENGSLKKTDTVSRYGYSGSVDDALKKMMISSSNEAAGALLQKVGGISYVNSLVKEYFGTNAKSYLAHTPAYTEAGGYNYVTADEQVQLMNLLSEGKIASKESSDEMLDLMSKCSDYFGVMAIDGIEKIYMKTGYNPPASYGLTGLVEINGGEKFAFSIYIDKANGGSVLTSNVKDIVELSVNYF